MRKTFEGWARFGLATSALLLGCGSDSSSSDLPSGGAGAGEPSSVADMGANISAAGGGDAAGNGTNAVGGAAGHAGTSEVMPSNNGGASGVGGATGSAGAAGARGSAGMMPHVVMPCPSGAGSPGVVGVWENITPPQIPMTDKSLGMLSAAVNPKDPRIVFTAGVSGQWEPGTGIFKSTDCGATWAKGNTGRNASSVGNGDVWQLLIDPVNPEIMFAINGYGGPPSLFKSTNGGTDWDPTFPDKGDIANAIGGNFTQAVSMDPSDSKHLLVTFHFNCTGAYAPMCMAESKDSGTTWRIFKGPASGWGEGANPIIVNGSTWLYSAGTIYYTSDSGATWSGVGKNGNGNLYRSSNGKMYLGSIDGILQSTDGHAWSLIPKSPRATGVAGDGLHIFATYQNDWSGHPYYSAPEDNPVTWINVSTPNIRAGASFLASYDSDHHILYAPSWGGGLWRVVTR